MIQPILLAEKKVFNFNQRNGTKPTSQTLVNFKAKELPKPPQTTGEKIKAGLKLIWEGLTTETPEEKARSEKWRRECESNWMGHCR